MEGGRKLNGASGTFSSQLYASASLHIHSIYDDDDDDVAGPRRVVFFSRCRAQPHFMSNDFSISNAGI